MYIGIDLGGTNIAAGVVDKDGSVIYKASVPTMRERHYSEIIKDMASLAYDVVLKSGYKMSDIELVGIGSPGTIDSKSGEVIYANNIDMHHVRMADEIRRYIDKPIHIENDANAAAYGEYIASGKAAQSFILMTLGTGIGGGIILDGKIYRGFNGAGAEIGHTSLVAEGRRCTCGRSGCLEMYASVTALVEQTKEAMKSNPSSMMNDWLKKNGSISGRTAFECAKAGDGAAIKVRDRYIGYVAEGVSNLINIFQPQMLVIGGGISREGESFLDPIRKIAYKNDYNKYMPKTRIRIARLFNDAGIVGAALAGKI